MHMNWKTAPGRRDRVMNAARTMGYALAMALLPVAVLAQDADDKPTPLDPQTAAAQVKTFSVVALLVVLFIGWYYFRRWQIIRAASHHEDRQE